MTERRLAAAPIAPVTFAAFDGARCALAAIRFQRAADVVLRFGEFACLPADVALVALVGRDLRPWHGLVPEEQEQDDDRDRNPEQPEKYAASHELSPLLERQRRGVFSVPALRPRSAAAWPAQHSFVMTGHDEATYKLS